MYRFYGWEKADILDRNGLNPRDLYDLLSGIWCAETCAPRMRDQWTPENPTYGQCSITAFLVQDLFGGRVYGVPRKDGSFHCFNAVEDCVFDLTSEQFGDEALNYEGCPEQLREVHFAREEKRQRYLTLRKRLLAEYAVRLKHSGFNCCQAVLCAFPGNVDLALLRRVGAGFGVGMGGMEATCGAICGAQILLGLNQYAGKPILREARALQQAFQDRCGATVCKDLKGVNSGVVLCECDDCVRNAVIALEEQLQG